MSSSRVHTSAAIQLLLCVVAVFGASQAKADDVLIGAPGVAGNGFPVPFGLDVYTSFQQVYAANLFTGPVLIGGLTFFALNDTNISNPAILTGNYSITLGTVSPGTILNGDPNGNGDLSGNLASSSDLTYFYSGTLSGAVNNSFTVAANQNNFLYNPANGDLILNVQANPQAAGLTLGLDYNNPCDPNLCGSGDPQNGLQIAYANSPSADTSGFGDCSFGCVFSDVGLVTQFNQAGQSESVPILPAVQSDGSFLFSDVPSGNWFDPATAYGFDYLGLDGTLFSGITMPTDFSGAFEVLDAQSDLIATLNGGDSYSFSTPLSEFSIVNIDPQVDPTDPSAFPLYIQFSTSSGSFEADPLTTQPAQSSTPEPDSAALVFGGILALRVIRRRARKGAAPRPDEGSRFKT